MLRKNVLLLVAFLLGAPSLFGQESPVITSLTPEGRLLQVVQTVPTEITDDDLTYRIAELYRDHAEALLAIAGGNQADAEEIVSGSVDELGELLALPGVSENIRFRELYRTIVAEYENIFGASIPDYVAENDEVFQLRAEIFSELEQNRELLLEEVDFPEMERFRAQAPPTVFSMDVEAPVVSAIRSLSQRKEHFRRVRTRADIYFPMIERILSEEGVPDELKYLAVVESALNPRAQSWARAVGLWQFIPETGAGYGLNISRYVDERRDPEKATRAAARHLRDLYDMFGGDWQLALAGYNCSPARVKREIAKAESRLGRTARFWDIMNGLPRETRDYVPLFIATYYIINDPATFELGPYTEGPAYEYDVVPVPGGTSIETIASRLGVPDATLKALNPELLGNSVPTSVGTSFMADQALLAGISSVPNDVYMFRIPLNSSRMLGDLAAGGYTQISYGARYATGGPEAIAASTPRATATEPTTSIGDLSKLIGSAPATTSTASSRTAASTSGTRRVHRVARGETLSSIANKYGVSVANIRSWNNLRGSKILRNQRLVVYSGRSGGSSSSASAATHRVRRGDTLSTIARRYGTSVSSIKRLNGLRSNTIRTGQRLKLR